jgi:hypothetical protein
MGNPLLFGNSNTGSFFAQFGSTGNFLIGTTADAGFRLDVNGTARVQGEMTVGNGTDSIIRVNSSVAGNFSRLNLISNTTNFSTMLDIRPNGTNTSLTGFYLRDSSTAASGTNTVFFGRGDATLPSSGVSYLGAIVTAQINANSLHLGFLVSNTGAGRIESVRMWNSGNVTIQSGGTFTDAGFRLDVQGTARITSSITAGSFIRSGGTSTQYLMADGSVSTLSNPITGTGTTNFLPKFTGGSTLGNSLIFDNGTNVGIGTTTITSGTRLEVAGNISIKSGADAFVQTTDANNLILRADQQGGTANKGVYLQYWNAAAWQNGLYVNNVSSGFSNLIMMPSGGNVGIGTTSPSERLTVSGNVLATAFFTSSDITLKNIIKTSYNPTGIEAISYKWKDSGIDTKVHVGYSAQQVQEFMPDAVSKDSNGKLSVNYVEVLVAKIAALEAEVKLLKAN